MILDCEKGIRTDWELMKTKTSFVVGDEGKVTGFYSGKRTR